MAANAESETQSIIEKLGCGCCAPVGSPMLKRLIVMMGLVGDPSTGGIPQDISFKSNRQCAECRARLMLGRLQDQAERAGLVRLTHETEAIAEGAAYNQEANRLESWAALQEFRTQITDPSEDDLDFLSAKEAEMQEKLNGADWSRKWTTESLHRERKTRPPVC